MKANWNPVILVLDQMPLGCRNCPGSVGGICHLYKCGTAIENESGRPDWCPLKELPQKQTHSSTDTEHHRWAKNGWNACLNEIVKDSEM